MGILNNFEIFVKRFVWFSVFSFQFSVVRGIAVSRQKGARFGEKVAKALRPGDHSYKQLGDRAREIAPTGSQSVATRRSLLQEEAVDVIFP